MNEPKVTIYRASDGWRWNFKSKGGRVLADGGQGYADKRDCIRGMERTMGGGYTLEYQMRTPAGTMFQQGVLSRWEGRRGPSPVLVTYFVQVIP